MSDTELIPVQGYPGNQKQRECEECNGPMVIKDHIWENSKQKRVSMKCEECENIEVATRERRMFRQRIKVEG